MDLFTAYIHPLCRIVECNGGTIIEEMEEFFEKNHTDRIWQSLNLTLQM